MGTEPQLETVELSNCALTAAIFGEAPVSIVMLHDGLGSISQWRQVPAALAEATNAGVLVYDRSGHGASTPVGPAASDWLHHEAERLKQLVSRFEITDPLIVGHSDGGSIALIYASSGGSCSGVMTLAAHSFVETICVEKITEMMTNPGPIVLGLARHHSAPRELFDSWSKVWTSPEFSSWDIRPELAQITEPVVVVQGEADAYATDAQLTETVAAIGSNAKLLRVTNAGHILHHEVPDLVVETVSNFYSSIVSQQFGS